MRFLRRVALLAVATVGAAVLAGPALGARPAGLPNTLDSAHFRIHFDTDPANNDAITQTTAGDVASLAERAYAKEVGDGFPAPASDGALGGDARTDIYVIDLSAFPGVLGVAGVDGASSTSSGYIVLAADGGLDQHTIAHELFHLIQFGVWVPTQVGDGWLLEGSAEWMGYRVNGYQSTGHPFSFGPLDMSLDCRDPSGLDLCDADDYNGNGYSRWPFFEWLAETYGTSFLTSVLAQGNAAGSATTGLANAFAAKGTTLASAYNAWIVTEMSNAYTVKALQGRKPTPVAAIETGVDPGPIAVPNVDVNHLATRFVEFTRGDDDPSHACYAATLNLSIALPAGTQSVPAFYWDAKGSTPVQLSVSGNTATGAIPWDTCSYQSNAGWLAIPNASTNVDAADFAITATLVVDKTTPATPDDPPEPATVTTPVVPVTGAAVAPTVDLFGPEVLRLSAQETKLRLIVQSSGPGTVQAKLGSTTLGTVKVRGGNNDLRFSLPANLLRALRRAAATSNVLTLTPLSTDGSATGTAVTLTVRVDPPAAKVKLKAKVKRHK